MSHTLSFLQKRFAEVGLRLEHRYGQNFLIDQNLLRILVDCAKLESTDVVLEVGTGTGALTHLISERAAAVVTVEIDPRLHQLASEELFDRRNITMLECDALAGKHAMNADVIAAVRQQLAERPGAQFKLVANLPYSIATPLVANLLESEIVPRSMTITIQKELADRIVAAPSTRDYGALSIWVQSQCRAELKRILPPSAFWPRPKVHSAILHVELDDAMREEIGDLKFFHEFARGLFGHRRKWLRSSLANQFKGRLEKPAIDEILAQAGLAGELRAEDLPPPIALKLSKITQRALG